MMKKLAAMLLAGCMILLLLTGCGGSVPEQPHDQYDELMAEIQKSDVFSDYTKKREANADILARTAYETYNATHNDEQMEKAVLDKIKELGIPADEVWVSRVPTMESFYQFPDMLAKFVFNDAKKIQNGTGNGKVLYFGFEDNYYTIADMKFTAIFTVFYTVK